MFFSNKWTHIAAATAVTGTQLVHTRDNLFDQRIGKSGTRKQRRSLHHPLEIALVHEDEAAAGLQVVGVDGNDHLGRHLAAQVEGVQLVATQAVALFSFLPTSFTGIAELGLIAGGGQESNCGWLKDPWGLSWQIIPEALGRYLGEADRAGLPVLAYWTLQAQSLGLPDADIVGVEVGVGGGVVGLA